MSRLKGSRERNRRCQTLFICSLSLITNQHLKTTKKKHYAPFIYTCEFSSRIPALGISKLELFSFFKDANQRFVAEKHESGAASQREKMLKDLAQAYDAFMELLANLQEGQRVT